MSASPSHHDDARDADLLTDGRIESLLARYELAILARCIHDTKSVHDGQDVAQDVLFRLFREFRAGKRYEGIPYRVVVYQVTKWTLADFFAGRRTDVPLPDDLELREDDPATASCPISGSTTSSWSFPTPNRPPAPWSTSRA
jgi:DNA-directed RNA polymerase specialized sigma24 family protein